MDHPTYVYNIAEKLTEERLKNQNIYQTVVPNLFASAVPKIAVNSGITYDPNFLRALEDFQQKEKLKRENKRESETELKKNLLSDENVRVIIALLQKISEKLELISENCKRPTFVKRCMERIVTYSIVSVVNVGGLIILKYFGISFPF